MPAIGQDDTWQVIDPVEGGSSALRRLSPVEMAFGLLALRAVGEEIQEGE